MERNLTEAAKQGDLETLHRLIKEDPFLLRVASLSDGDNPLHVACIGGRVDFARHVVSRNPDLAGELNRDGLTPLHIAALAAGAVDILKELLTLDPNLCLVKGKEKRIPLHCAVIKGRVKAMDELISACPDSIMEVTARGESCFHLAVKNNQFEAFKALCLHLGPSDRAASVLNGKDGQGNAVLHIAACRKQYEVLDLLLDDTLGYKAKLELNSLNKDGLTPLDILIWEGGDPDIEHMLRRAGAITGGEIQFHSAPQTSQSPQAAAPDNNRRCRRRPSKQLEDYFKYDKARDSPGKARNTLFVISVLIVTATYQAVLSPPGGIWQDTFKGANGTFHAVAGKSVMATISPRAYGLFLMFNSAGFFMSLHIMNILTLGLPLQFELRAALCAMIVTYDTCMVAIVPNGTTSVLFTVAAAVMPVMIPVVTMAVRDFFGKKGWICDRVRVGSGSV